MPPKPNVSNRTCQNLTNLTPHIKKEDHETFFEQVNEELALLNELAKPGDGYELTLCHGGVVQWEHYDSQGDGPTAKVTFNPKGYPRVLVEVPRGVTIEIREITKLP